MNKGLNTDAYRTWHENQGFVSWEEWPEYRTALNGLGDHWVLEVTGFDPATKQHGPTIYLPWDRLRDLLRKVPA